MQKDVCYKCIKLYRFIRLVLGEDISDRAIARKLGMDWRGFYNMKTGSRKVPRVEILEKIAGELEVNKHFVIEIVSGGASPEQIYKMARGGKIGRELKLLVRDYPPEGDATDFEEKHLVDRRRIERDCDIGVVIIDHEGKVINWNGGAIRIYGWTSSEAMGKQIGLLYGSNGKQAINALVKKGHKEQSWQGIEEHCVKGGGKIKVDMTVTLLRDKSGELTAYVCAIRNVPFSGTTEKSKTLNAIIAKLYGTLDEQEVYRIISQEMIPRQLRMRVYTIDDAGKNAYLKIYSLGKIFPAEILKRFKLDENRFGIPIDKIEEYHRVIRKGETIFVPDLVKGLRDIARVKKIEPVFKAMRKFMRFDQSIFTPLQAEGEIFGAFALESPLLTSKDIPLVKAFADQIAQVLYKARLYRESEEQAHKYQSLLYSAGEPIFLINADSKKIEEANQEAQRLSGFELSELMTKNILDLFMPTDKKMMRKEMNELDESGRFQMENINLLTSRGEKVPVSMKASIVHFGTGDFILQVLHKHCN